MVRSAEAHEISVKNIFENRDNLGPHRIDAPDKRPSTCQIAALWQLFKRDDFSQDWIADEMDEKGMGIKEIKPKQQGAEPT